MTPLYLTEADVDALVTTADALVAVERAFAALAAGEADNVPRMRSKAPGIILHTMSAAAGYLGIVGWKNYCTTREGAKFLVGLYRSETGDLAALIEADRLGQIRTGAVTGVAVKYLSPEDVSEIGLFGTGYQAEAQLEAVAAVRKLRRAVVYGRDEARRHDFAKRMSQRLQLDVQPVELPADAVRNLPIVITATSSRAPVFENADVCEGTLICAIGSNWLHRAEIDPHTVSRAQMVICDSVAACRHEAGDLVMAAAAGHFDWSQANELSDVVAGKVVHKDPASGITLFKSVGLAIEDVALGAVVLERATARGVGRPVAGAP